MLDVKIRVGLGGSLSLLSCILCHCGVVREEGMDETLIAPDSREHSAASPRSVSATWLPA